MFVVFKALVLFQLPLKLSRRYIQRLLIRIGPLHARLGYVLHYCLSTLTINSLVKWVDDIIRIASKLYTTCGLQSTVACLVTETY